MTTAAKQAEIPEDLREEYERASLCGLYNGRCCKGCSATLRFIGRIASLTERGEKLAATLEWVMTRYNSTLEGGRVRDADECLSAAKKAIADWRSGK